MFIRTTRLQIIKYFLLFFVLVIGQKLGAQAVNTEFGKNRVQFHNDFRNWWRYETENFISYWYGKGKRIAPPVIQMAEMDHDEIQNIMEHRFNEKIEIVVYVDLSDIKQSNIGIEDAFINRPKITKTEGNKMFVYFNGDHKDLQRQIRQGIASVYLSSILVGSNLQEMVQNAVLLSLPEWYQKGLVAYAGSYWDTNADDELRELLSQNGGEFYDFEKLGESHPYIAGHSFWYFIDQHFGKSSISNLLYLTKINKNLKNSFLYVLSQEYESLLDDWANYYRTRYTIETNQFEEAAVPLSLNKKKDQPISQFRLSPEANQLLYVVNDIGKYKIYLRDFSDDSDKQLFVHGERNAIQETDYNYPLIDWHPYKNEISIIYEKRDKIYLRRVYLSDDSFEEQVLPTKIQRVYSLSYLNDTDYVLSASDNGLSNLFIYKSKTRNVNNITDDYHDDLDAIVATINNKHGVLFSSTRPGNLIENERLDTILPLDNFDLFFLPFEEKVAQRLSFTPQQNERYPFLIDQNHISYLSNEKGITNRYIKNLSDDKEGYPQTNVSRNIIRHHSVANNNLSLYEYYKDGAYQSFLEFKSPEEHVENFTTVFVRAQNNEGIAPLRIEPEAPVEELKEGFLFVTPFNDPKNLEDIEAIGVKKEQPFLKEVDFNKSYTSVIKYNSARAVAARKSFKLIDLSSKLNNDLLYQGLEIYEGSPMINQPLGIFFKGTVKDLFEDYEIDLGARFPTSFNGSEYFIEFENKKKRIDKKYVLYRRSRTEVLNDNIFPIPTVKNTSLLGLVTYKYPFNLFKSLSVTARLRNDRYVNSSLETNSFELPVVDHKRLALRIEYIYDNTLRVGENILNGQRYKIYSELGNKFLLDVVDGFNLDVSAGTTGIVGLDYRIYFPLKKHSVLAIRTSLASSFGSDKMIYFLGGVENEFFAGFDNNVPLPSTSDFAFKARAPQLRGFQQNIRNGSSFALVNTELRIPFIKHLKRRVSNNFLRNLQVVGFFDLGTAWHGRTPYSSENPLNSVFIESPPTIKVNVDYFRDPVVYAYGLGLRSSVFGYFLKLDFAYGVETRTILSPRFHFSFGSDF